MYDLEPSVELDEQMVAAVPERDRAVLAGILGERTASFAETVSVLRPTDPLTPPRATVGALTAVLALNHHLAVDVLRTICGLRAHQRCRRLS